MCCRHTADPPCAPLGRRSWRRPGSGELTLGPGVVLVLAFGLPRRDVRKRTGCKTVCTQANGTRAHNRHLEASALLASTRSRLRRSPTGPLVCRVWGAKSAYAPRVCGCSMPAVWHTRGVPHQGLRSQFWHSMDDVLSTLGTQKHSCQYFPRWHKNLPSFFLRIAVKRHCSFGRRHTHRCKLQTCVAHGTAPPQPGWGGR